MVYLSGKLGGGHNFSSNKNNVLQDGRQIVHLEGAFAGAF
jgi:hypothetical protein